MGIDRQKLLDAAKQATKDAYALTFEEKGWKECKTSNGITIYKIDAPAKKGQAFKAETLVEGAPSKVFDIFHPDTTYYKPQWDPHCKKSIVLKELDSNVLLMRFYLEPSLMGLVGARDSVDVCTLTDGDEFKSIGIVSVDVDDYPPEKDFIRIHNGPTATFIFPTEDPNKSKVICLCQTDFHLKHVPTAVPDMAMPKVLQEYLEGLKTSNKIDYKPLVDVPGKRDPAAFAYKE